VRRCSAVGALTLVILAAPAVVFASFASTPNAPHSVATALLAAPTSVSAVRGTCSTLSSTKVNLTWTASSSSQTTGYEIFRSTTSGSGYASVGTTASTSFIDSTVAFSTRYYYVVQSSRNLWRSVNSNEDPVTTQSSVCLGGSDT
jgi:fibronectin type 3 domain-containing protein